MPFSYALAIYRGDSYTWRFLFWLDPERTQPLSLADATPAAAIRTKTGLVALTCVKGGAQGNQIDVALTAAQSQLLATTPGTWDLQLTYTAGAVRTVVAGTVSVAGDVTGSAAVVAAGPAEGPGRG